MNDPPAPATPWTHRFKEPNTPADYQLFDHVWLSASVAHRQVGAGINRRTLRDGDGSDHDPAWVDLDLDAELKRGRLPGPRQLPRCVLAEPRGRTPPAAGAIPR